jgi:hypothetical protein
MIVEATANQVDVDQLHIGAAAHVRFDAFPKLTVPARVFSVGPLARSSRWRGDYVSHVPVFLKLEGKDQRLIPSLAVSADVVIRREESEVVPREAVIHDSETGTAYSFVRTPSGWEKRTLTLGPFNNVKVAVRDGLEVGDMVAIMPQRPDSL